MNPSNDQPQPQRQVQLETLDDLVTLLGASGTIIVQVTRIPAEPTNTITTRIAVQVGQQVLHGDIAENVIASAPNPQQVFTEFLRRVLATAAEQVRKQTRKKLAGDEIVVAKAGDVPPPPNPKNRLRRL